jgi:hypothetical protein
MLYTKKFVIKFVYLLNKRLGIKAFKLNFMNINLMYYENNNH